jgi:hypothetical protein
VGPPRPPGGGPRPPTAQILEARNLATAAAQLRRSGAI